MPPSDRWCVNAFRILDNMFLSLFWFRYPKASSLYLWNKIWFTLDGVRFLGATGLWSCIGGKLVKLWVVWELVGFLFSKLENWLESGKGIKGTWEDEKFCWKGIQGMELMRGLKIVKYGKYILDILFLLTFDKWIELYVWSYHTKSYLQTTCLLVKVSKQRSSNWPINCPYLSNCNTKYLIFLNFC